VEQLELFKSKTPKRYKPPREFKIVALLERPPNERLMKCEDPIHAVEYWRRNIATADWYCSDRECFVVILLNSKMRILGHHLVAIGSLDSVYVQPREVFRAAIIAACHSVVIGHNHPSGDPTPSDADLRVTRELARAGEMLRILIIDHVVIGRPHHVSLKQAGYF